MKVGTFLGEISRSLFKKPATELYPFEKRPAPARLRGRLLWEREKCTGCGLCIMDCPSDAIELFTLDKAAKRYVFRYHVDRCTYCAQCTKSCRQGALEMSSQDWELANFSRDAFTLNYGEPADVRQVLAGATGSGPGAKPAA